jgi:hypothetical protein
MLLIGILTIVKRDSLGRQYFRRYGGTETEEHAQLGFLIVGALIVLCAVAALLVVWASG